MSGYSDLPFEKSKSRDEYDMGTNNQKGQNKKKRNKS